MYYAINNDIYLNIVLNIIILYLYFIKNNYKENTPHSKGHQDSPEENELTPHQKTHRQ